MNEHILLVEDEEDLRMTLCDRLQNEGYIVDVAVDGNEGLHKATSHLFELIVLDIMLPKRSGLDVCRDIRNAGLTKPILLLTARDQIIDKVVGLRIGADDYMTKPFHALELMARIAALLRRAQSRPADSIIQHGPLRMDVRATEVTLNRKVVELSPEFGVQRTSHSASELKNEGERKMILRLTSATFLVCFLSLTVSFSKVTQTPEDDVVKATRYWLTNCTNGDRAALNAGMDVVNGTRESDSEGVAKH